MSRINSRRNILNLFKYSLLFYLLIFSNQSTAQLREFKYKQITTEDGLVDDMALRIRQDAKGYLWFGTRSGLVKYDGTRLHTYTFDPNQPDGLNGNNIDALHLDDKGNLWIGTINGLCRYDPIQDRPINIPIKVKDRVLSPRISGLTSDKNGMIWISSFEEGLFSYDPITTNSVHYNHGTNNPNSLPSQNIPAILCTRNNEIWIGTRNGLARLERKNNTFENFGSKYNSPFNIVDSIITSLAEDENGDIWIGTRNGGLKRLNIKNKSITKYKHSPDDPFSLSSNLITSILADKDKLWLGCGRGSGALQSMDINTGKVTKYKISEKKLGPRIRGTITDIFKDNSGIIWVSQSYGGVSYFDPIWENYQHYQLNPQNPRDLVNAVYGAMPISDTELWLSSFDGFILFDRENGILRKHNDNGNPIFLRNNPVKINNQLWAPSDHGIVSLDLKTGKVSNPINGEQGLAGKYVNKLLVDDNKYIWAGSRSGGLDRINAITGDVKHYVHLENDPTSLPENSVFVFFEKDDQYLWIGTNGGLALFDKNNESFSNYPYDPYDSASISSNQISDICLSRSGTLWIGTYGGGLNRLNRETQSFSRYTSQNNNIPNNTVYSCIEDNDGKIWISTAFAIGRFSPENEMCDFILKESDYYKVTKLPGGELCYSGPRGVLIIDPNNIEINSTAPLLSLESIAIEGELQKVDFVNNLMELEHNQNDIEFKFFASHFSNAAQNKYSVRLEGYDNEWRSLETSNFINYTNLEPGYYTLYAKAASSFNIWTEPLELKIQINLPWWQTWWAYSFYTIMIFGFLYSVRKFELKRQRKNAALKEGKLRAEAAELQAKAAEAQSRVIQAENDRKTQELEEARQLQLSMLPKELPKVENLDIAVYMKTATEVGGDYYDFAISDDGTLIVGVGDATGHGMQAGTIVTLLKGLFTSEVSKKELLTFLNDTSNAIKGIELGRLMMAFSLLRIKENLIQFSSAGMPPMYIFRKESNIVEEINLKGMPLGAIRNFEYKLYEAELTSGDCILLLSDGYPELENSKNEQIGYKRLKIQFAEAAEKQPDDIIQYFKDSGSEWVNDQEPEDDVTFVVIKVK